MQNATEDDIFLSKPSPKALFDQNSFHFYTQFHDHMFMNE